MSLSDLRVACGHLEFGGVEERWDHCPGGRPATLEDLEALGEKVVVKWCETHDRQAFSDDPSAGCRKGYDIWKETEGRGDFRCAVIDRTALIPIPQMVAGESL